MEPLISIFEIFNSIEGEGIRTGAPVTFIRLAGCNLRCSYCDTCYAQEKEQGNLMRLGDVLNLVKFKNVTITGGEPLLQGAALTSLIGTLKGHQVNIETNGSIDLKPFLPVREETNVIFTMDYKLAGSGVEKSMLLSNIPLLQEQDVLKFVVTDLREFGQIEEILTFIPLYAKVFISPCWGSVDNQQLVKAVMELQQKVPDSDIRFQLQLHKLVWNPEMRGV